jgi:hypothetical protein
MVMTYIVALHACGHLVALNVDLVGLPHVIGMGQEVIEQLLRRIHVLAQVLTLCPLCSPVFQVRMQSVSR